MFCVCSFVVENCFANSCAYVPVLRLPVCYPNTYNYDKKTRLPAGHTQCGHKCLVSDTSRLMARELLLGQPLRGKEDTVATSY